MAHFYIGMAADQDGRRAEAESIWRDLLANAPPDASWTETVRHALERKAPTGAAAAAPAGAPAPGPSAADVAAASKLSPDEQTKSIQDMVAGLAARLKKDGSNVGGWVMLVRSYRVLGQNDKAEAAMADARRALANDPDKLRQLTAATATGAAAPAAPAMPSVPPSAGAPGPSAADIAAAAKINPDQQNQMIRGMVARLADKLKQDGSDVEGWQRLLRAYMVLGERDKARAAAGDARQAPRQRPRQTPSDRRRDQIVRD